MAKDENFYLDRIEHILNSLTQGADRTKLANELGYTNPKSLDIFMRRKGFLYDKDRGNYTPIHTSKIKKSTNFSENKRISNILAHFTRESSDPRKIAELTGFSSHVELAEFMKHNGFAWNDKVGNYIKINHHEVPEFNIDDSEVFDISDFYIYLPILKILYDNQEAIMKIIDTQTNTINMSSHTLKGTAELITISINENLNKLITKYSTQNFISLTKLLEAALLEYLLNHNFQNELYPFLSNTTHDTK